MNEGLRAELQDPHGMGGTTPGSFPLSTAASLPPTPSFPSQGDTSHTGREERQPRPPSKHTPLPRAPRAPPAPTSTAAMGLSATPTSQHQHPPLQPQAHPRPAWGWGPPEIRPYWLNWVHQQESLHPAQPGGRSRTPDPHPIRSLHHPSGSGGAGLVSPRAGMVLLSLGCAGGASPGPVPPGHSVCHPQV